jgi:hypothetical protein
VPGCTLSSFSRSSHRTSIQWIFRYLKYTLKFGILYFASSSLDLVGFFDADFVGCGIDKKALLIHVIFLHLLLCVGLLANNLLLHNLPSSPSM